MHPHPQSDDLGTRGRIPLLPVRLALSVIVSFALFAPVSSACGTERWSIKTLTDPAATSIDFHARSDTVAKLRLLRRPRLLSSTRLRPYEFRVYRVRVELLRFKLEADEDIHLVIADPGHRRLTMIVEFPSRHCTAGSVHRTAIRAARTALVKGCGSPHGNAYTKLSGSATLIGVGFWDSRHGQSGVAPNAFELHPVLGVGLLRCRSVKRRAAIVRRDASGYSGAAISDGEDAIISDGFSLPGPLRRDRPSTDWKRREP